MPGQYRKMSTNISEKLRFSPSYNVHFRSLHLHFTPQTHPPYPVFPCKIQMCDVVLCLSVMTPVPGALTCNFNALFPHPVNDRVGSIWPNPPYFIPNRFLFTTHT